MNSSAAVAPLALFALFSPAVAWAAHQPGEYSITTMFGQANARSDSNYDSDQTISLAMEYQKTRLAAYRASVGFLTLAGDRPISPSIGDQSVDALFMTGNIVTTPRFNMINPFLAGGVGVYSLRLSDDRGTDQSFELGVNWGFGMDVQVLRHLALRGEVQFHYTTGEISNPIQILAVGAHFNF